jgi:hypothetical protein
MKRTVMFSDELNYFPAVHYNLRGREPDGVLLKKDMASARRDLEQALLALRDPWTGRPVVDSVHAREELFVGPHLHRAPDLLLGFHLDTANLVSGARESAGYSYNLAPSANAPAGCGAWRRLGPDEIIGRKGQGLSGSHRPAGLLIAAGPRVPAAGRIRAGVADATAAVVSRLGLQPPPAFSGSLPAAMQVPAGQPQALPDADMPPPVTTADQGRVQARLRALGYIE